MDIPSAATAGPAVAPWLVLGVVLGVGLVLLVGLGTALLLRRRTEAAPRDPGGDDLPGFLESPPGSAAPVTPAGWASLAAPPASPPAVRPRRHTVVTVTAMTATALLLLGVAAAVAAVSRPDVRSAASRPPAATTRSGAEAKLTFGGVVLEPRAVGVTATYPVVELSTGTDGARARVEFPTFNCLTGDAPADPVAAGCTRSVTEYAELASPGLVVRRDGDGLAVSGRFATELRPNGGPPAPTGRVYQLQLTVAPAGDPAEDGWRPARGVLELGPGRATTVDDLSVLRASA